MIPKIIHQIWIGSPIPPHLLDYMQTWRVHHPAWKYYVWCEPDDFYQIPHKDLFDRAEEIVPADAVGQFRSDIARYAILHAYGGLYVDCDTECLRPVDDALYGHDAWAAMEDTRWVGNTYLAVVPGHPVTRALIAGLRDSIESRRGRRLRPNRLTGPQYLTPIWRKFGCYAASHTLWYPYSYTHVKRGNVPTNYGNAYAVHHWQHTRELIARRQRLAVL
jgi:mannosyltransferase OCH1-like enzyme